MNGKGEGDGVRVAGGVDELRFLGCMLLQLKNGSCNCQEMDALELSASVCILMRSFRTQYSSFANQMFAVFSAESLRERERERERQEDLGHIVRLFPDRACPLPCREKLYRSRRNN